MRCERFRELIPAYLDEALSEPLRREFRTHLAACTGCRRVVATREPSLLLVGPPVPVPAGRIEAVVTGVRGEIRRRRLERRLAGLRRRWMAAAAAAVLAAAAGGLALLGGDEPALPAPVRVERAAPPVVVIEAGPGAVVYQPASGDGDTAVALVVDPGLEL